jgi:leucyl-tRNA synthetase
MVVQVNGKVRDRIEIHADATEEEAIAAALASAKVKESVNGAHPKKVIARAPKLVNLVI